jgi:hypothetical protein
MDTGRAPDIPLQCRQCFCGSTSSKTGKSAPFGSICIVAILFCYWKVFKGTRRVLETTAQNSTGMHTKSSFTIIPLAPRLTLPRRLTPRSTSVLSSTEDMSAPGDQSDGARQILPVGSSIVLSSPTAGEGHKV